MPRTLNVGAPALKNAVAASGAWVLLATVTNAAGSVVFRWVNDANILPLATLGQTYQPAAFTLAPMNESLKGDLPRTRMTIYDPRTAVGTVIPAAATYAGFTGGTVTLALVYRPLSGTVTHAGITHYFTIMTAEVTNDGIVLELGITSPLNRRFPRDRYVATVCHHTFRMGFCRFGEFRTGNTYWVAGTEYAKAADVTVATVSFNAVAGGLSYIFAPGSVFRLMGFLDGQLIEVSGTLYNNGVYNVSVVSALDVPSRIYLTSDSAITQETVTGGAVRIRVLCDHTLSRCRANASFARYGGSPGIAEGNYG